MLYDQYSMLRVITELFCGPKNKQVKGTKNCFVFNMFSKISAFDAKHKAGVDFNKEIAKCLIIYIKKDIETISFWPV